MTLLHLSASPRTDESESLAIASTFLERYRAIHADPVDEWDLWDGTLPAFGPDFAHAKMAIFAGRDLTDAQRAAWEAVEQSFRRFDAADTYLLSIPMWNAGVPYVFKQFIDVVSQPGMVFGFDPDTGYTGLLRGKRAVVIYTSAVYGPDRPPSFGIDFQAPYVEEWLRWTGIDDIRTIAYRPNLAIADPAPGRQAAHRRAVELADAI